MGDAATVKWLSVTDLMDKWKIKKKTLYRIVASYKNILQPIKLGREFRFKQENVTKFEEQMRVVKEDE